MRLTPVHHRWCLACFMTEKCTSVSAHPNLTQNTKVYTKMSTTVNSRESSLTPCLFYDWNVNISEHSSKKSPTKYKNVYKSVYKLYVYKSVYKSVNRCQWPRIHNVVLFCGWRKALSVDINNWHHSPNVQWIMNERWRPSYPDPRVSSTYRLFKEGEINHE